MQVAGWNNVSSFAQNVMQQLQGFHSNVRSQLSIWMLDQTVGKRVGYTVGADCSECARRQRLATAVHTHSDTNSVELVKARLVLHQMLQHFLVFLLPFSRWLQDNDIHNPPTTACSLCNVPGMPGNDMHTVAWN
jgi:hypothetical protein